MAEVLQRLSRFMRANKVALLAVGTASILARFELWREFLRTPLDLYGRIDTLDMKFIFEQAQSLRSGGAMLTMHRVFGLLALWLNGGSLSLHALVAAQMLLGVLTALLVCAATLRVSGSRLAGLVAGVLAGCYAPGMMYELFALKETVTLFFAALALWTFFAARRGVSGLVAHGLAAAALPLARPLGAPWAIVSTAWVALRNGKRGLRLVVLPILVFALAMLAAWAFDRVQTGSNRLLDANALYNLKLGAEKDAVSYTLSDKSLERLSPSDLALRAVVNAPRKFLALLNAFQTPDNVNYYFIREKLPLLKSAPGPLLLLPFGLAGLLFGLWLAAKKRKWRFAAPALHFLCFAAPVCVFVTSGRYALFLMPSLAAGAGCFVFWLFSSLKRARSESPDAGLRRFVEPAALALLWAALLLQAVPRGEGVFLRVDDFIAYGMATNMKNGNGSQEEAECYAQACALDPDNANAAIAFSKWLVDNGHPDKAVAFLEPFNERNPGSFGVAVNLALALNMLGRPADAEKALLAFGEPKNPANKEKLALLLKISRANMERKNVKRP